MALVVGTNVGFVTVAPTSDPTGGLSVTIDNSARTLKDTSPATTSIINEVGFYTGDTTEEANFEVGLYSDSGGDATTLLFSDKTNAKGTSSGWIKVTGLNWSISANTTYHIAIQLDNTSTATTIDAESTGTGLIDAAAGATTLPDPTWTASPNNGLYAIYAVVSASSTIIQSNTVYKNNETITQAKLTAEDSGNVNYYMSADTGSNWESVTPGVSHTFTNTGQELKWRASATGSASISSIEISY